MKKSLLFFIAGLWILSRQFAWAEWRSIEGKPAKWGDIIEVQLRDIHPTQPSVGYDRIYYKLGRYEKDRRKIFDDYCRHNGQKGIRDFSYSDYSNLHDPKTFACLQPVGTDQVPMKSVVIAPDGNLYLTNGHHTYNLFWTMPGGGPDLHVYVKVDRDYRDLASMDEFWKQMVAEKNIWLFDNDDHPITVQDLPKNFGLENFYDDSYRSLMYFAHRIAWDSPRTIAVPDPKDFDDRYPDIPFTEFYWAREVRKTVNLSDYDLMKREGYVAAIKAVGQAVMNVRGTNVGGSGMTPAEMGQYQTFNLRELKRIDRPGTGKIAYLLAYKAKHAAVSFKQTGQTNPTPAAH